MSSTEIYIHESYGGVTGGSEEPGNASLTITQTSPNSGQKFDTVYKPDGDDVKVVIESVPVVDKDTGEKVLDGALVLEKSEHGTKVEIVNEDGANGIGLLTPPPDKSTDKGKVLAVTEDGGIAFTDNATGMKVFSLEDGYKVPDRTYREFDKITSMGDTFAVRVYNNLQPGNDNYYALSHWDENGYIFRNMSDGSVNTLEIPSAMDASAYHAFIKSSRQMGTTVIVDGTPVTNVSVDSTSANTAEITFKDGVKGRVVPSVPQGSAGADKVLGTDSNGNIVYKDSSITPQTESALSFCYTMPPGTSVPNISLNMDGSNYSVNGTLMFLSDWLKLVKNQSTIKIVVNQQGANPGDNNACGLAVYEWMENEKDPQNPDNKQYMKLKKIASTPAFAPTVGVHLVNFTAVFDTDGSTEVNERYLDPNKYYYICLLYKPESANGMTVRGFNTGTEAVQQAPFVNFRTNNLYIQSAPPANVESWNYDQSAIYSVIRAKSPAND